MNAEMNFNAKCVSFASKDRETERPTMEQMKEMGVISEKCSCSTFTLVCAAASVLMAIGSVVYSIIAM